MIADTVNTNDDMGRQRLDQGALKKGNHFGQWKAGAAWWKVFFFCLSFLPGLKAEEVVEQAGAEWRVWFEAKYMHAQVAAPIRGAERTEWVAGLRVEGADEYLSKEKFAELKLDWAAFRARALVNSDLDLAALKPEFIRDRKKIIQYAVLESKEGWVSSAVLGTKLLGLFRDTLGEKILVVVPNRYRAYIFPALASSYQEYYPLMLREYGETAYPVSLEVFELSREGWKTVGIYEEP